MERLVSGQQPGRNFEKSRKIPFPFARRFRGMGRTIVIIGWPTWPPRPNGRAPQNQSCDTVSGAHAQYRNLYNLRNIGIDSHVKGRTGPPTALTTDLSRSVYCSSPPPHGGGFFPPRRSPGTPLLGEN